MLGTLDTIASTYGLKLHPDKTEHLPMVNSNGTVHLNGKPINAVTSYKYLGCNINKLMDDSPKIRSRLAIGKQALNKCAFLKKNRVRIDTKLHLAQALIMSKCHVRIGP